MFSITPPPNNSPSILTFIALFSSCPFSTFYYCHCFVSDFFDFLPPCHMPVPINHPTLRQLFTHIYKQHHPHSPTHSTHTCVSWECHWSSEAEQKQRRESCLTAGMRWDSFPVSAVKRVKRPKGWRDQIKTTVPITHRIYWTFWLTAIKTPSIIFTWLYLSKTTTAANTLQMCIQIESSSNT